MDKKEQVVENATKEVSQNSMGNGANERNNELRRKRWAERKAICNERRRNLRLKRRIDLGVHQMDKRKRNILVMSDATMNTVTGGDEQFTSAGVDNANHDDLFRSCDKHNDEIGTSNDSSSEDLYETTDDDYDETEDGFIFAASLHCDPIHDDGAGPSSSTVTTTNCHSFTHDHAFGSDSNQMPVTFLENQGLCSLFIPSKPYVLPLPILCKHCGALKFKDEPKGFCCCDGAIKLKKNETPHELHQLFTSNSAESKEFKTYVRTYNSNFSFTSFGVQYDKNLCRRNKGVYTFRIQGQIYHFINDILVGNNHPSYMQLYFFDTENELQHRLQISDKLSESILAKLIKVMELNPYAIFFRTLTNIPCLDTHILKIRTDCGLDQRVYNTPSASQEAAIWVDDDPSTDVRVRDITVSCNSGEKHQVHYYFGCYDPLQYPLLFPYGETGWHQGIVRISKQKRQQTCANENLFDFHELDSAADIITAESAVMQEKKIRGQVSCREYYCYKLQVEREKPFCIVHYLLMLDQDK